MRRHSTIADIAYCLYHTRRCAYTRTYTTCTFLFLIQSLIDNVCHSLCRVTRGFNILCQIMVTFLSYISNACHSLSGAERLQHTQPGMLTKSTASILPRKHGLLLNLSATPVTLGLGVARGSNIYSPVYINTCILFELPLIPYHVSARTACSSNIPYHIYHKFFLKTWSPSKFVCNACHSC